MYFYFSLIIDIGKYIFKERQKMNKTLSKLLDIDLAALALVILYTAYSIVKGSIYKNNKLASILKDVNISKYIDKTEIIDKILNILGNSLQVITAIYILVIVIYIFIVFIIPFLIDFILYMVSIKHNKYNVSKCIIYVLAIVLSIIPGLMLSTNVLNILIAISNIDITLNTLIYILINVVVLIIKPIIIIKDIKTNRMIPK